MGLMEFAGCLDGLGLTLGNDDIAELAFKYRCPEGVMEGEGASGMGVDYAPFVRFIVDATGGRRRRGRGGEEGSGSEGDEEEESEGDREEEEEESEEEEEERHGRKGRRRRSEEEEDFSYGRKASKRYGVQNSTISSQTADEPLYLSLLSPTDTAPFHPIPDDSLLRRFGYLQVGRPLLGRGPGFPDGPRPHGLPRRGDR